MIREIRKEMDHLIDIVDAQNEMIQTLMINQAIPTKAFYPEAGEFSL